MPAAVEQSQQEESLPLVSVGLTSYQRPEGLRDVLSRVTRQTYSNLEIIVSDNCSGMPAVDEVLDSFAANDPRIRVFRQQTNIGMEPNHTFVARQATGRYFLWLHDDDEVPDDYIERCVARFGDAANIELVGPRGDRFLDGKYWRSYHTYSNLGTDTYERLARLIPVAYYGPSFFEQYFYGVFNRKSLQDCVWQDGKCYFKETFSMFFRLSERGYLHVADDVTIRKYNVGEDLAKWRDAKYIDRPLRYKFAGDKVEQLIPRTLNILRTVFRSDKLTRHEKLSLARLCGRHFLRSLSRSRKSIWYRLGRLPSRLLRKLRHVVRKSLEGLLRRL